MAREGKRVIVGGVSLGLYFFALPPPLRKMSSSRDRWTMRSDVTTGEGPWESAGAQAHGYGSVFVLFLASKPQSKESGHLKKQIFVYLRVGKPTGLLDHSPVAERLLASCLKEVQKYLIQKNVPLPVLFFCCCCWIQCVLYSAQSRPT